MANSVSRANLKHKKFKIDIDGWDLVAFDGANDAILKVVRKAVVEVLEYALEDEDTYIYFPVEWSEDHRAGIAGSDGLGGSEVTDPLTVYLRIAICSGVESPTWEFNLRDALRSSIEESREDGSWSPGLGRLSIALRELADEIDEAIKINNKVLREDSEH